jgi:hypothetical protein
MAICRAGAVSWWAKNSESNVHEKEIIYREKKENSSHSHDKGIGCEKQRQVALKERKNH